MIDEDASTDLQAEIVGDDDDGAFLLKAKQWFATDRDHRADWAKEAIEAFDFVAGHQWSEEDKAKLRDEMRPVITFNRTQATVESIVGLEIGNRREVKYYPREAGDAAPNEILSAAAEWARDECDAEDEETDAFFDNVVCGMGWTETRLDHEDDPEGMLVVDRIDPLEMFWDASARKRNLADARRLWRVRTIPVEEAKELFPGIDVTRLDAAWARQEKNAGTPHNADPEFAYLQDAGEKAKLCKEVTLVHLQWWEREPYYRIVDPFTGQIAELSVADHEALRSRLAVLGIELAAVRLSRKRYRQAFIGSEVLKRGDNPCPDFTWQCITGKRDQNRGTFYGIVRSMMDPQRWANKWLSQALYIFNSNAKGGLLAERGAFEDDRQAEESWSKNDKITWVKEGMLSTSRVQPKPQAQFPTGIESLMQFAIASIRDSSGVNLELLGLKDTQQAGVLEEHRKQAGMTILAMLFDSLRRYRKRQGRVLLYYLMHNLSDGRLIRIVGDDGAKYVPLVRQPGLAKYDVIVDDAPTSPNQKEKIWNTLVQLLPIMQSMLSADDMLALAEYSPLPTSVVEKLKAAHAAQQKAAAPKQQMQERMTMQAAQAALAKTASETAENQAQAEKFRVDAAARLIEAQADAQRAAFETVPAIAVPFGVN